MAFEPIHLAFSQFQQDRSRDFAWIASRTRGTHDPDDLKSEAWLMAMEIGKKRGRRLDLFDKADQKLVLAWLYKRYVDYVDGKLKESIDQGTDDESVSWKERLLAPLEADPLAQLERLDDEQHASVIAYKGFSQYSAYMILLARCEMSFLSLADYLSISFATLRQRIEQASEHADRQLSLFELRDIDSRFVPRTVAIRDLLSRWVSSAVRASSWIERSKDFLRSVQKRHQEWYLRAQRVLFDAMQL